MFYYYQIRNHHYTTEAVPDVSCPLCGTTGQLHMSVLQKYTWMIGPMAPSGKYAIAWCTHCNQYIPKVRWTDEMDTAYTTLKRDIKTPGRLYRGLWVMPLVVVAFIAVIFLITSISNGRQKKKGAFVQEATVQPRPGDIFQVIQSMGSSASYLYYKVARTTADSVYVQESTQRYEGNVKEWDNIPTDAAAYEPEQTAFSLEKIKRMDGMFSQEDGGTYISGIVWGVWRDGELHKKY